ncbi:aromatic ring-hydroxylating dioxygenase subunit alpha [Ammoniphilus sp. 3BR4]|uniref:aromatic ring-hydroxylating oxygenase subunit alpha n=1 Tax=Ammoniphilus sp. 3BR4 TaxID=3158265 RepID=UPI003466286D
MVLDPISESGGNQLIPTLKGEFYTDSSIFEREMAEIFSRSWYCIGFANEIADPGQYLTTKIGHENILVVRGRDNQLRAFLNVCKHRGSKLCIEPRGQVGKVMQCPYHAWSYSLDGSLAGVPHTSGCSESLLHNEDYHLTPVHLQIWHGMIWLNLADQPVPIDQQLDFQILSRFGNLTTFGRYRLEDLQIAHRKEYVVDANWKLIIENFQECYHCTMIHPELTAVLPGFRAGKGTQNAIGSGASFSQEVESFSLGGKGSRPRLKGLLPEDDRIYYGMTLLPHVFINLVPDHVIVHRLIPLGANKTKVICDWLFDPEVMAQAEFDPSDAIELFHRVNVQDFDASEWCQDNMNSKAYQNGGVFVPIEHHIANFHHYIMNALGAYVE